MAQGIETRPYVPWALMNAFMTEVFMAYGVPAGDAAICADVLLEADRAPAAYNAAMGWQPDASMPPLPTDVLPLA